jgi:hypothetical protein
MAKTTKTINNEIPYTLKAKTVATENVFIVPPYPITINVGSPFALYPAYIAKKLISKNKYKLLMIMCQQQCFRIVSAVMRTGVKRSKICDAIKKYGVMQVLCESYINRKDSFENFPIFHPVPDF